MRRLEAEEARQRARALPGQPLRMTIVVDESTGLPYKGATFPHVFQVVRAKAAELAPDRFRIDHLMPGRDMSDPAAFTIRAEDLTFMDLRHTAVTRLVEAGCDPGLVSAITGHSQSTVVALMNRYMVKTATMDGAAGVRETPGGGGTGERRGRQEGGCGVTTTTPPPQIAIKVLENAYRDWCYSGSVGA